MFQNYTDRQGGFGVHTSAVTLRGILRSSVAVVVADGTPSATCRGRRASAIVDVCLQRVSFDTKLAHLEQAAFRTEREKLRWRFESTEEKGREQP